MTTVPASLPIPAGLPILARGNHDTPAEGACIMEFVSVLAGEEFTDHPDCVDASLIEAAIHVNDSLLDEDRHVLLPLLHRFPGTAEIYPRPACDPDCRYYGGGDEQECPEHGLLSEDVEEAFTALYDLTREYNRVESVPVGLGVPTWLPNEAGLVTPHYPSVAFDHSTPAATAEQAQKIADALSHLLDLYDRDGGRTQPEPADLAALAQWQAQVTA